MMRFENPALLHLLWALLLQAIVLLVYWRWRQRTLRRMGSPALAQRLLLGFSKGRFWLKNLLFAAVLALLAVGLANPYKIIQNNEAAPPSADIFIALDVSQSMMVRDVAPNRLGQAKAWAEKLVKALEGERIGLIFFAGDAYPQMPLSTDYETAIMFLRNADTDFILNQGTAMPGAIDLAERSFEASGRTAGHALILITDGENHVEGLTERAKAARKKGLTLFAAGVGTLSGGPLPGNKRDARGQVVQSKLDLEQLRELARNGGGIAVQTAEGDAAIAAIDQAVDRLQKETLETGSRKQAYSYYQWVLLPALLLLALEQLLWWRKRRQ
jgi:Ca-activated chloride channel homolog